MQQPVEAPTPAALAALVERCSQINRFSTQLTAAETTRVSALAAGLVVMRQVLSLEQVPPEKLPTRQARIEHWALVGPHLAEAETPAVKGLPGLLVLDGHEQVKLLTQRNWRGQWGSIVLWRDGEFGLRAAALMDYLAKLTALANKLAPDVARALHVRSQAVAAAHEMLDAAPRSRG